MPEYDKSKAVKSGFAQVKEALQSFEGDVVSVVEGKYPPRLDEDGKPMAEKEYLEISCINVGNITASEELSMAIEDWNFRVSCSLAEGSFWMEDFLPSVDKHKINLPKGLEGKRVVWKKVTRKGTVPIYDYTSFVIDKVMEVQVSGPTAVATAPEPTGKPDDPMVVACDLAVGKTETQFRSAISLHPSFVNSPLLKLAKTGAITNALVEEGKLVVEGEGDMAVYKKV